MKKLALFLITILMATHSYTQQFAPVGAEWYNNTSAGIFHLRVEKDTVIDNIQARQVIYTPHISEPWASWGFRLNGVSPRYVWNNDDTVFIYNVLFKKFTPLYVFNVNDGDTVTLPLTVPGQGCAWFQGSLGDSLFSFVVDSVRVVQFDTAYLQTFYTRHLSEPGRQQMSFPVYARVLGGLSSGLLPNCDSCVFTLSANCAGPDDIRCYHSTNYDIKLVSDDCAKGIKVSVQDIYKEGIAVSLYPNPASDLVIVNFSKPFTKQVRCILNDIAGREIWDNTIQAYTRSETFDVSKLPTGQYSFVLLDGDNVLSKSKLAIVH